jgi:hypothetical protein
MMTELTIVEVVNANTLRAIPVWHWGDKRGTLIRIDGLPDCAEEYCHACPTTTGLNLLLLGSDVSVRRVRGVEGDALRCELHYRGRNLARLALKCQVIQCRKRVFNPDDSWPPQISIPSD